MGFVLKVPHKDIMASLRNQLVNQKLVRWKIPGTAIPPSWEEAFNQIQKNQRMGNS